MKVEFSFSNQVFTVTLYDKPSSRDFASMLPLELKISDFSNNEKIAHLPRKLTTEGNSPYTEAGPGDVCYYIPWGNLAFFYAGYSPSRDLVRLGRPNASARSIILLGFLSPRCRSQVDP